MNKELLGELLSLIRKETQFIFDNKTEFKKYFFTQPIHKEVELIDIWFSNEEVKVYFYFAFGADHKNIDLKDYNEWKISLNENKQ